MQVSNVNLPIKVTGRHISVTEAMKDYAIKKIQGLHLDYPKIIEAQVILDVQKYRHMAEVILICNNHITIESGVETEDMYASIDQVIDKINRQMRKYKTKIMRHHRPRRHEVRHFPEHVVSWPGEEIHEEAEPNIVTTEKYVVKPMFLDEAVVQMEMSQRQFLVFLNAETEKISVIYRRNTGDYAVIEPTVENGSKS